MDKTLEQLIKQHNLPHAKLLAKAIVEGLDNLENSIWFLSLSKEEKLAHIGNKPMFENEGTTDDRLNNVIEAARKNFENPFDLTEWYEMRSATKIETE